MSAPILGCGIAGLLSLDPASVSLVLSDLPSGETAAEFDNQPDLPELWRATWHALAPGGCAIFMASSLRFAMALVQSQSATYRYDLIWEKTIATGHLNASLRPLRAHEFILVFARTVTTFNPQMVETGVPIASVGAGTTLGSENYGSIAQRVVSRVGATDRHPRSVLHFGSLAQRTKYRTHPQQKPHDLLCCLVRQYSNRGELVVDPFAGSGSTLEAAEAEGRRAIGWDSDERFGRSPLGIVAGVKQARLF